MTSSRSLYERAGGMVFFERLVGGFYARVETDAPLRALYPEPDLAGATRRLTLFLAQYWGGPKTYEAERGHPRLKMRHAPFAIDRDMRDRWLAHMRASLAELVPPADVASELDAYLVRSAEAMRNTGPDW